MLQFNVKATAKFKQKGKQYHGAVPGVKLASGALESVVALSYRAGYPKLQIYLKIGSHGTFDGYYRFPNDPFPSPSLSIKPGKFVVIKGRRYLEIMGHRLGQHKTPQDRQKFLTESRATTFIACVWDKKLMTYTPCYVSPEAFQYPENNTEWWNDYEAPNGLKSSIIKQKGDVQIKWDIPLDLCICDEPIPVPMRQLKLSWKGENFEEGK